MIFVGKTDLGKVTIYESLYDIKKKMKSFQFDDDEIQRWINRIHSAKYTYIRQMKEGFYREQDDNGRDYANV